MVALDASASLRSGGADAFKREPPASWNDARRYAVVVDAGSSGSRMQVYSWKDPLVDRAQRERNGLDVKVLPKVEKGTWEGSGHDWQLKVEPGLSTFGTHPHDLDVYLKPLFDHARSIIPPDAVDETPVYVLATAGMRLLPEEQQKAVLESTCAYIQRQTPFKLDAGGCAEHVQIIKGEEEGLLGWIGINYLMDGFHYHTSNDANEEAVGHSTFGFLDMGGASTQIAFEPSLSKQTLTPDTQDDLTPIALRMLDGTDVWHNVFVTTFLGFGTNKAYERYMDALMPSLSPTISSSSHLPDPCLPKDLVKQAKTTNNEQISVVGSGQFDQCLKSLAPLLDKEASCSRPPCLFHGVHVPPIDFSVNHFIGVSEYWFSSNDVFKLGGAYDFVSFQKAAEAYCGTSWDLLKTQLNSGTVFGKQVTLERLEMQCFKSAWMATVLHEGIGLPRITDPGGTGDGRKHADDAQTKADAKNLFQSVNDVNGLAVSWTLGKAVLEASKNIPPLPPTSGPHHAPVHGETVPPAKVTSSDMTEAWQDKFISSTWQQPSKALNKARAISGAAVLAVIAVTFLCLVACVCLRGRSPKALKRRTMLKDFVKAPCGQRRTGHGDYTLANMEEGGLVGNGREAPADVVMSSDTSGDEDIADSRLRSQKRRRSSGNGFIAAILVPLQRLGLALGIKTSSTTTHNKSLPLSQRRIMAPRYGMRHHTSPLPVSMSQPSSPKAFSAHIANGFPSASTNVSRPSSRASPRYLHDVNSDASAFFNQHRSSPAPMHSSSALTSTTATATASARSSRAASPIFGHSAHSAYPHHSSHLNAVANGRPLPSSRTVSTGFSRKAWEDSD